jgi:transposase
MTCVLLHREIDDLTWQRIADVLPPRRKKDRRRVNDRLLLSGILYVLLSGCRWAGMPQAFGSHETANRRFRELSESNAGGKLWRILMEREYTI